jgi:hypothetical protein
LTLPWLEADVETLSVVFDTGLQEKSRVTPDSMMAAFEISVSRGTPKPIRSLKVPLYVELF